MADTSPKLTPIQFAMTAASVGAAVLPHLWRIPPLFSALIVGLLGMRIAQRAWGASRVPVFVKLPLLVLIPLLVVARYGNVFGREPGATLACAMLALKLIETETRRDARAAIAFSCFVLMSALLFDAGMLFTLMLCAALAVFLAALRELELRPQPRIGWRRHFVAGMRKATFSLLAAVPLTLCVFVFLPRLGSPLWGTPTDPTVGHSGLGDSMDPASLQELLIDDSPAFRVSFDGPLPERSRLYWRGPVLSHFDGRVWSRPRYVGGMLPRDMLGQQGRVVTYDVTLEPSDRRWLLALDLPLEAPDGSVRDADMTLVAAKPVDQLQRYRLSSALSYEFEPRLGQRERERNLALPARFDPRARELAQRWRQEFNEEGAIIRAALAMYHKDFSYSLAAPELGIDSVDDFLFETRKGFCQHFASSFTFLMRAAGIPARVVTGYQGGFYNELGNYLVVRQSDAHAWSEVWRAGVGWVRIDPTSAVSPQRVDLGARAAAGASAAWYQASWLQTLRNQFDLINRGWNSLVVQFNMLRQQSLLAPFGVPKAEYYDLIWVLIGSSTLLLGLYSWLVLRQTRRDGDALDQAYARLCRKLERAGAGRAANEGPASYAARVAAVAAARPAGTLVQKYAALRYACVAPSARAVQQFAAAVRRLRLPPARAAVA